MVACRPDLEHATAPGGDARFVVTYTRFELAGGRWHRRDRRVAGFWENDGDFPARSLFP